MKMKLSARLALRAGLPILALGLAACSNDTAAGPENPASPDDPAEPSLLLAVIPSGGSTGVDPNGPVTVTFDHPMIPAMAQYAAVHEGDVRGPDVAGTWSWSADHTTLTFTPASPLEPATPYTIHLGGGMTDGSGAPVNLERHGPGMGGEWATASMMEGGGMGGMGGGSASDHMGSGWQHPNNGTYGMVFRFTTGE